MSYYSYKNIYITGTKRAVVDFVNRGLKGSKCTERVSVRMTGEQIVDVVNGLKDKHIEMDSYLPSPRTFLKLPTYNPMKDFTDWYAAGCVGHSNYEGKDYTKRMREIEDYMEAHPEVNSKEDALRMMHPDIDQQYAKYVRQYKRAKAYQKKKYGGDEIDWNFEHYGCKWPASFTDWKVEKESEDKLCLYTCIETSRSSVPFYHFINKMVGITVYMFGSEACDYGYYYNGKTDEARAICPFDDKDYDQKVQAYEEKHKNDEGYDPDFSTEMWASEMIDDFLDNFIAQIEKEL